MLTLIVCAAILTSGSGAAGISAAAPSAAASFDSLPPIAQSELGQARAGQGETYAAISTQTLSALNSGNAITANTVNSGGVDLQSGAFAGFSGLGNFVINTGNNNNLQGSLNVTVVMAPAVAR